jgi:hypothetical protein
MKENESGGEEVTEEPTCWKNFSKTKLKIFEYNQERIPKEPSFFMAAFSRQKQEW